MALTRPLLEPPRAESDTFERIDALSIYGERTDAGSVLSILEEELRALPKDAADFAGLADGCESMALMLGRPPTAADLRMYRTFEAFYGLRLGVLASNLHACEAVSLHHDEL